MAPTTDLSCSCRPCEQRRAASPAGPVCRVSHLKMKTKIRRSTAKKTSSTTTVPEPPLTWEPEGVDSVEVVTFVDVLDCSVLWVFEIFAVVVVFWVVEPIKAVVVGVVVFSVVLFVVACFSVWFEWLPLVEDDVVKLPWLSEATEGLTVLLMGRAWRFDRVRTKNRLNQQKEMMGFIISYCFCLYDSGLQKWKSIKQSEFWSCKSVTGRTDKEKKSGRKTEGGRGERARQKRGWQTVRDFEKTVEDFCLLSWHIHVSVSYYYSQQFFHIRLLFIWLMDHPDISPSVYIHTHRHRNKFVCQH